MLIKAETPAEDLPIDYSTKAEAANTTRAHSEDLERFVAWGGTIPATVEMIEAYLSAHANSHKPATLVRWLASISIAHKRKGLASPCQTQKVRDTLNGIKRVHGTQQRRVAPAVHDELLAMVESQNRDLVGLRNRALLLLGFGGAMRRSEVAALTVEMIQVDPRGLTVNLGKTKTDQTGEHGIIGIPAAKNPAYCPAKALAVWLQAAAIGSGPIFRAISKSGKVGELGLTGHAVAAIIKSAVRKAGMDPTIYSGHSLRAGLVTSAVRSRKRYDKIKQQTRHRSDAMLARYIRDDELFEDNAADLDG